MKKTKKKKTAKISFEEYEAMANAIATHLRSLENEVDDVPNEGSSTDATLLTGVKLLNGIWSR
jgi:hypothetical protein